MKKADKKIRDSRKAVIAKVKRQSAPVKKLLAEKEVVDGKVSLRDAEQIAAIRNEQPTWKRGDVITGINGGGKPATYRIAKVDGGLVKIVNVTLGDLKMPSWYTARGFAENGFRSDGRAPNATPERTPLVRATPAGTFRQGRARALPKGTLTREYKGKTYTAEVVDGGVLYEGQIYRTLNPVAMLITGAKSINGPKWWGC